MEGLPTSPTVEVTTITKSSTLPISLPSLVRSTVRGQKKTANQRVEEILLEAAAEKKKSAHFWDDKRRIKKAQRLSRLYNGNIEDPIIKRSVQKRTDDEKDGAPDGSFFVLPGNHSDAGSIRTVRDPIPFNKSHLRSAKEKMNLASEKYDEFTSDALRRFDDKEIYPEVLQDLLFRVFMVKFSLPECAAIVSDVDKDNSGSLDYAEFLTSFFHLAFNHKQELALEQDYSAHKARDKLVKEEEIVKKKFASGQIVKVPENYNEEHLHIALDKVAVCSSLYDRTKGPHMHEFDSRQMDPTGFKQQLLRMFGIRLTLRELGALFEFFDADSSGLIDMTEFLLSFFQLAPRGAKANVRLEGMKNGEPYVIPGPEVEDQDTRIAMSAMKRIRNDASRNPTFDLKASFDKFDRDRSGSISHEELRKIVTSICKGGDHGTLSENSIQCFIKLFDPNGDGEIKYDEFAYVFFNQRGSMKGGRRLDKEMQKNIDRVVDNIDRRREEREARWEEEQYFASMATATTKAKNKPIVMTKQIIRTAVKVMDKVRQRTAKMSLKEAFNHFDIDNSGTISHDELVTAITEVSGKKLKDYENAAVIAMFDPNNDGSVHYDEFCWTFYNRRAAVKTMEHLMNFQQAAKRVDTKHAKELVKKMHKIEANSREYLPEVKFGATDSNSTKTAKIASTLINSLQKNKQRIRQSSLKQSRSATIIRCSSPEQDRRTGQGVATLGREFKAKILRYDMKWVALKELQALLYRKSTRNQAFIEMMHKDTFNNGMINRKDFNLMMIESLNDHNQQAHNRLYSCFDPDHDDSVFIGEIAVGLEAICFSGENAGATMAQIFPLLVEAARAEEYTGEGEDGSIEHRQHEAEMRANANFESIKFEKLVSAWLTLALRESDEAKISKTFRDAWENDGLGQHPPLMFRRDQPITLGGKYQDVSLREFKEIVANNPELPMMISEMCIAIQNALSLNSSKGIAETPQVWKGGKDGKGDKGRKGRKGKKEKERIHAKGKGRKPGFLKNMSTFHMEEFEVHENHEDNDNWRRKTMG